MVIKHKNQRIVILIDIQNLYHSAKKLYGSRVNFKNLLEEITTDRQLVRAIAYGAKSDEPGEASFFDALEKAGIEIKTRELQIYPNGSKKGDWDVGMAVDAIRLSAIVDVIILVTGDGDFIPLVEYLKGIGRQVEIAAFGKTTSSRLKEIADDFLDLDTKPSYFLIKSGEKILKPFSSLMKKFRI